MSSRQDRSDGSNRPMMWIYGTGIVLCCTGIFIGLVSVFSFATRSWTKVGFLLEALSGLALLTIPGALLALRHPWGAVRHLHVEQRRFAHPRLVGLAEVWAGLVISALGAIPFVADIYPLLLYWLLPVGLVALAPLLALYLFDRRR